MLVQSQILNTILIGVTYSNQPHMEQVFIVQKKGVQEQWRREAVEASLLSTLVSQATQLFTLYFGMNQIYKQFCPP